MNNKESALVPILFVCGYSHGSLSVVKLYRM